MSYKLAGLNSLAAAAMLYFSVMLLYSGTVSDKYPGFTGTPYTSVASERGGSPSQIQEGPEVGVSTALSERGATIASGSPQGEGEKRGASAVEKSVSREASPAKKLAPSRLKEEETGLVHSGEHLGQLSEEVRNKMDVKTENFVQDGLGHT